MGAFDVPAPLFGWLDAQLAAVVPPAARVALWGIFGGMASMLIYRAISHQERVARAKAAMVEARRALDAYDGEFADAWPLMRRMLALAFVQVGRVGWSAVVASLPLLSLLAWISTAYGYRYPDIGATPDIDTRPPGYATQWIPIRAAHSAGAAVAPPRIVVRNRRDRLVADVVLAEPVPVVHQRKWWNTLIANPAGYLPRHSELRSIHVSLPRRELLPVGHPWMRGWEAVFFAALLAASIMLKVRMQIE